MELEKIEMTSLIPQRPPFMMVDRILSCDDSDAVTEFMVRQDNILLDENRLSSAGIVENMAQSCAARMGCVNLLHNRPIKLGRLVSWRIWHSRVLPEWVV